MKDNECLTEGDKQNEEKLLLSVPLSSFCVYALDFISINSAMLALLGVAVNYFEGMQHEEPL